MGHVVVSQEEEESVGGAPARIRSLWSQRQERAPTFNAGNFARLNLTPHSQACKEESVSPKEFIMQEEVASALPGLLVPHDDTLGAEFLRQRFLFFFLRQR